jgi:hypothetical protein
VVVECHLYKTVQGTPWIKGGEKADGSPALHALEKKNLLSIRYYTVRWLRHQKVKWDDVFSVAAEALDCSEVTIRRAYMKFKQTQMLEPMIQLPEHLRDVNAEHVEHFAPFDLPLGPDEPTLYRVLDKYRADKRSKSK